MKKAFCIIASSAIILSLPLLAQEWPQWRGVNRDGKTIGFKAPKVWPQELKKIWQVIVGSGDATPALVGDRLFVFTRQGAEEVVRCLRANDGGEVWRVAYPAPEVTGPAASHPGPRSTPLVVAGKVVVLGVAGELHCYDAADGKLLWKIDEYAGKVPDFFPSLSPLAHNGVIYAHLGGKTEAAVLAVDLQSGQVKWKLAAECPSYASPIMAKIGGVEQLILYSEKSLFAVDIKTPRILWSLPLQVERFYSNAVSPVLIGDRLIVTGQGRGTTAYQIRKEGTDFTLKEIWRAERGNTFNTPIVCNGSLWNLSDRGIFYGLRADDGRELWAGEEKHDRFGSFVDAGDAVFMLSATGRLIVLKPEKAAYHELARYTVSEKAVYAHPLIAGNRIYIKDDQSLTLWAID
ncbi:MAG: PQQ-binding-like beta-propeller repeat protein [candidate division KSB1 bacterium]|nr:PQQ-binding-like beta-propeller repeat protein [candidate division KSB1 bacterium]